MSDAKKIMDTIKEKEIQFVDLRFTDPRGKMQHLSQHVSTIDEESLAELLVRKKLGGAGLDVFEHEPQITQKLFESDNVVLLPHISSATSQSREAMGERVLKNILFFAKGKALPDLVVRKRD